MLPAQRTTTIYTTLLTFSPKTATTSTIKQQQPVERTTVSTMVTIIIQVTLY